MDLTPSVYDELRARAAQILRWRRVGDAPETVSLVNEACVRMLGRDPPPFTSRAHLLDFAAKTMRSILVDLARRRSAQKRGGGRARLDLDEGVGPTEDGGLGDVLDVHEKLEKLGATDERKARIVELRYFGGCTWEEVGEVMGLTRKQVLRDWDFARAWLHREMNHDG